jgi:hypothetical protein
MTRQLNMRLKDWLPLVTLVGFGLTLIGQLAGFYAAWRVLDWRVSQLEAQFHNGINKRVDDLAYTSNEAVADLRDRVAHLEGRQEGIK